jgi:Helix-turn-helix domain
VTNPVRFEFELTPAQLDLLAARVADLIGAPVEEWLDTNQAAKILGFSETDLKRGRGRVHDLAAAGKLATARDGRRLLIGRKSIENYIRQ